MRYRELTVLLYFFVYFQVKSSRIYIRDCSLVSPYAMLLFGGDIEVKHTEKLLAIDDNVKYSAYAKTGVMFKELRKLLDSVLSQKLDNPKLDITSKNFSVSQLSARM